MDRALGIEPHHPDAAGAHAPVKDERQEKPVAHVRGIQIVPRALVIVQVERAVFAQVVIDLELGSKPAVNQRRQRRR